MKYTSTIRFSDQALKIIRRLKRKLGVTQSAIIEMALRQFDETMQTK